MDSLGKNKGPGSEDREEGKRSDGGLGVDIENEIKQLKKTAEDAVASEERMNDRLDDILRK